jgi:ribosomal protein L33
MLEINGVKYEIDIIHLQCQQCEKSMYMITIGKRNITKDSKMPLEKLLG